MKENETDQDLLQEDEQEELIRRLLKLSGGRPAIPEEIKNRVEKTVHSHWKQSVRKRSSTKIVLLFSGAIAATLLLFTLAWHFEVAPFFKPSPVAIVENQIGTIILGEEQLLSRGTVVVSNSMLESGDSGRALLRTMKGVTMRLDTRTRVRLESESSFVLEHGAVYLDSENTKSRFNVSTPMGRIENHGTQFEIRLADQSMEIRVREGSVSLTNQGVSREITAGNRLQIDSSGRTLISEFASYGPQWDWVSRLSPPFHLEGRNLREFLAWITHENGWALDRSSQIQDSHGRIILHGSVESLTPTQMLEAVLPVCGLTYNLNQGILSVTPAERK